MLTSLALIFLAGLAMAALCSLLRLPRIIGMLFTGILLGPYVLGLLDPSILAISADLRQMALIIILIKAGLSLDLGDLRRVGRPAVLMSFLPASFEILAYILFAPMLLGITRLEAAVMGAVLGAVSPAVVVPRMVRLMEEGRGTREGVPQLILAGASCDDVFVIVLFSAFTGMAQGGSVNLAEFVGIPVSICTGILLGLAVGWLLCRFFDLAWNRGLPVRGSMKVLIVLGIFTFLRPGSVLTGAVLVYGVFALITGIADIVFYVKMERHTGFGPVVALVSGILSVIAGLLVMVYPGAAAWALTIFFPLWFIMHCISRLTHLGIIRYVAGSGYYYFSLILNIIGLVLGFLMLLQPALAFLSMGFVIGAYLILLGIDSLVLAFSDVGYKW